MNESKAKQVCKKRPQDVICHTETQLIRCYPNARRFDSSNFSPVHFWSCGLQLVALNYQTIDSFQILNQALFEQTANVGYVLKPPILWDNSHPEYGRFNPFDKKKENEYIQLNLKLISGQFLTDVASVSNIGNNVSASAGENTFVSSNSAHQSDSHQHAYRHQHRASVVEVLHSASTFVEIEIIGIACDCTKEKTKTFNKNALNPIWNEEFVFHVVFPDLAFVKFSVIDSNNNHVISQRVIPLKCLRQGYRHIKLRNTQNQPLELGSIFVHSRQQVDYALATPSLANVSGINSSSSIGMTNGNANASSGIVDLGKFQAKHKQFKLTVYGLNSEDEFKDGPGVQVKVTQDTTVQQVIEQVSLFTHKGAFIYFQIYFGRTSRFLLFIKLVK